METVSTDSSNEARKRAWDACVELTTRPPLAPRTPAADIPGQVTHDATAISRALAAIPADGLPAGVAAAVGQARDGLGPVLELGAELERWCAQQGPAGVGEGERQWPLYAELVTAFDEAHPALELAWLALDAFARASSTGPAPRGWATLGSQVIHQGPFLTVRRDDVRRPDGQEGFYEYIEMADTVRVVALNAAGEVALLEDHFYLQPTHPVLHLPGGAVEKGEGVLIAAGRELEQETGWRAGQLEVLGCIDPLPGAARTTTHLLLATDLAQGRVDREPTEAGMTMRWTPAAEAVRLALAGGIREAGSLAAILLAQPRLPSAQLP
ncbi:NUDIX domain-containing protein [Kitasatospora sp. NPDC059463]|uniref:NUDIX domain-containing protein n=1 Tax=unclassified Kitasatospora TaxID=2633591 RepID=UPI003693AFF3